MAKSVTTLPKRCWRRDRIQVRAVPEYSRDMYVAAFGHEPPLNVMTRRWKERDGKMYCYKCNQEVSSYWHRCINCQAEIDDD